MDYGGLAVLNDPWSRCGLGGLFADLGSPRQRDLPQAVICSRLLFPCGKLPLFQRAAGTWLAPACGLETDESFDKDGVHAVGANIARDERTGMAATALRLGIIRGR